MDEESLVLHGIQRKPDLSKEEIARIKRVAVELVTTLCAEFERLVNWREKAASCGAIHVTINDCLWSEDPWLPLISQED